MGRVGRKGDSIKTCPVTPFATKELPWGVGSLKAKKSADSDEGTGWGGAIRKETQSKIH